MLEQLQAPEHVLCLKMAGEITGSDIEKYRSLLEKRWQSHDRISICIDLTELRDFDANALALGAQADLDLMKHLDQIDRLAFITNKQWPRALAGMIATVFPTIDLAVFDQEERDAALEWVSEADPESAPLPAAIKFIPTSEEAVLGFAVDGIVTAAEFPAVIERFQTFFESHDKARLLNRMTGFKGAEPAILTQSGLIAMKLAALQNVERYAIVGAPRWIAGIVLAMNAALPQIDIRIFDKDAEPDAWAWLEAQPLQAAA